MSGDVGPARKRGRPIGGGDAAATREAILDAARTVFERDGYRCTATISIATRAGCSSGSLYHHFPGGRAAVFAELVGGDRIDLSKVHLREAKRDATAARAELRALLP